MKVTIKILTFATLLFSLLLPINAQRALIESDTKTAVTDCINLSISFTEDFYESAYLNKDFKCSVPIINEDYEKIINSKFEYVKAPRIFTPCNNFSIKFKEAKFIETDEYIYVCLPITAQYYNLGNSSFSNLEFFTFKKTEGSYVLENWCTSSDIIDFDFYLFKIEQFVFLNIEEYISWLDNSIDYSDYTEKAAEATSSRKEYFQKEKIKTQKNTNNKNVINSSIQNSAPERSIAYSTYSKEIAASWALANYSEELPFSSTADIEYYDFSTIPGNYDCTNFVSHALLAGGCDVYDTGNTRNGWWCRTNGAHSASWSDVNQFYSFVTNNYSGSGFGIYGYCINNVYPTLNNYELSNIIQVDRDLTTTNYNHSLIVVDFQVSYEYYCNIPRIVSRTSADIKSNDLFSDYYNSNYRYRLIIKVIGFRS